MPNKTSRQSLLVLFGFRRLWQPRPVYLKCSAGSEFRLRQGFGLEAKTLGTPHSRGSLPLTVRNFICSIFSEKT